MKIGDLAKRSGCTIQAIRHYEKEQLLVSAQRSEGNFRLYDSTALERLLFIKRCRSLDLALPEIFQLIALNGKPETQCDEINKMVDKHIDQVEQRIDELQNLHQQLALLRGSCSSDRVIEQCGILQNLSSKKSREAFLKMKPHTQQST